jgi:glycine dehydrogenase subunit 2
MIMAAYHRDRGEDRTTMLVPDTAHGTNPASAVMAGFDVETVPSTGNGLMDVAALEAVLSERVAGAMLTCPDTLGLFHPQTAEIVQHIHDAGALAYCDGANLNALLGKCRPGDIGFDIMHVNLHKTFAAPHGGGGPGAGPLGVGEHLVDYLPVPLVVKRRNGMIELDDDRPASIGPMAPFYGNFAVILKAYAYLLLLGREGLERVSENAVLNANYVLSRLKPYYTYAGPADQPCKHECVLSASPEATEGVSAFDIAKALIDYGFHPPTIYFPLTVEEALMIEPTETESKETLDAFCDAMIAIAKRAETDPQSLHDAPRTTSVSRLDEVRAAKWPDCACV